MENKFYVKTAQTNHELKTIEVYSAMGNSDHQQLYGIFNICLEAIEQGIPTKSSFKIPPRQFNHISSENGGCCYLNSVESFKNKEIIITGLGNL